MKNAIDTIKTWAWGFIDLMLIFIAVGVLAQVIWAGNENFFLRHGRSIDWSYY